MSELNRDPGAPEVLYHYTTREGLLGICEHKKLWATSIRHLNDAAEFTYAFGVLRQALIEAAHDHRPDVVATVKLLEKDLDTTRLETRFAFTEPEQLTFVASFSEQGDQLSQWRAYGSGAGYSLGFRREALETIARQEGFELVRCSYDRKQHRAEAQALAGEVVFRVIERIPERARATVPPAADRVPPAIAPDFFAVHHYMLDELERLAPRWKHHSFEEENEWRLVSRQPQKILFRAGRSVIVPYTTIKLDHPRLHTQGMLAVLAEVYIGPSDEQELAAASAMQVLSAYRIACPSLIGSATPLRPNWSS